MPLRGRGQSGKNGWHGGCIRLRDRARTCLYLFDIAVNLCFCLPEINLWDAGVAG
jgi:hypothetical protein